MEAEAEESSSPPAKRPSLLNDSDNEAQNDAEIPADSSASLLLTDVAAAEGEQKEDERPPLSLAVQQQPFNAPRVGYLELHGLYRGSMAATKRWIAQSAPLNRHKCGEGVGGATRIPKLVQQHTHVRHFSKKPIYFYVLHKFFFPQGACNLGQARAAGAQSCRHGDGAAYQRQKSLQRERKCLP